MLSKIAENLILMRYAHKGETPNDVFKRVARVISVRDKKFEEELFDLMTNGIFLPNSPAIRNAGIKKGSLSACFVLPLEDTIGSIFECVRNMALIFQRGGGVGINFSNLRPNGAPLSSGGSSSGALSFMNVFDAVIETVKQGGFRRGAALGAMNYSHPEIMDFCRAKLTGNLTNFNLSVMVTDEFMEKAITSSGKVDLVHEGKTYKSVRARDILDLITLGAWSAGDPGMLFYDRINKDNKLFPETKIICTNPCGEQPLPEFGACCLGSINISKFVEGNNFNFDKFYNIVKVAGRALLNINTINWYPLQQITKTMHDLNSIGIGIMGFADTLIMLGIKYDSQECLDFIDKLSKPYVQASEEVAPDSFTKRSIAPTGTLSILGDCSASIEPVFARSFERRLVAGTFEESRKIYDSEFCRTAYEVSPEWHLKIQAKFQSFIDSGVSKTVNVPNDTGADDIKQIYIKAWKMGVKGITIFREDSKEGVWVETENKAQKCDDEVCYL
jgi:ribonucleoside-diphosphate reductase alpha chain